MFHAKAIIYLFKKHVMRSPRGFFSRSGIRKRFRSGFWKRQNIVREFGRIEIFVHDSWISKMTLLKLLSRTRPPWNCVIACRAFFSACNSNIFCVNAWNHLHVWRVKGLFFSACMCEIQFSPAWMCETICSLSITFLINLWGQF